MTEETKVVATPNPVFKDDKEDKEKFLEEEVEAALEEELGKNWLADKPLWVRIVVTVLRIAGILLGLYFFLCALTLMGDGFTAVSGKGAGSLFSGTQNPFVGLMVGILATVLVQSSSTTTSIIVVLVANGIIEVQTAIPMIMGANIGTTVTNTIVSLGFADDSEAYRRGFAGATVHDMFNYLNVCLLFPIEIIFELIAGRGPLQAISEAISGARGEDALEGGDAFKEANPIKKITSGLVESLIEINKDVVTDAAQGFPAALEDGAICTEDLLFKFKDKKPELPDECEKRKCVFCEEGEPFNATLYDIASEAFDSEVLIKGGRLEALGDKKGGITCLILSFVMLIAALAIMVKLLTSMIQGSAKRILVKSLNYNFVGGGYLAIFIGCAITFVVQSSSVTTSMLTPLVAVDALSVENMFPYTLGANIGTTGTGLIAAAAAGERNGYTVALVHLFFNVFGTLIWYPIPAIRRIPINAAKFLGEMAGIWKIIPVIYILFAFVLYPVFFFLISLGFQSDNVGAKVVVSIVLAAAVVLHIAVVFWYKRRDGKNKFIAFVAARKARLAAKRAGNDGKQVSV